MRHARVLVSGTRIRRGVSRARAIARVHAFRFRRTTARAVGILHREARRRLAGSFGRNERADRRRRRAPIVASWEVVGRTRTEGARRSEEVRENSRSIFPEKRARNIPPERGAPRVRETCEIQIRSRFPSRTGSAKRSRPNEHAPHTQTRNCGRHKTKTRTVA